MTDDGTTLPTDRPLDMSNPTKIAQAADRIYETRYKDQYEREHKGQYVAIDVRTEEAYLSDSSDGALERARQEAPHGVFHLIRVGSRSAFKATRFAARQDNFLWAS